jgi:hypothetical protein
MTEIQLPCCDAIVRVEALEDKIRCESCGVVLELAADEIIAVPVAA